MTIKSRIIKLSSRLRPQKKEIHLIGWANCTWTKSNGLERQPSETKDQFISRVIKHLGYKKIIWFD